MRDATLFAIGRKAPRFHPGALWRLLLIPLGRQCPPPDVSCIVVVRPMTASYAVPNQNLERNMENMNID